MCGKGLAAELLMDTPLQELLVQLRHALETLYGARLRRLVLFGSHARGEASEASDIDVLVVLNETVNAGAEIARSSAVFADLSLAHEVVIAGVFVSGDEFERAEGSLVRNVRREGISV